MKLINPLIVHCCIKTKIILYHKEFMMPFQHTFPFAYCHIKCTWQSHIGYQFAWNPDSPLCEISNFFVVQQMKIFMVEQMQF